MYIKEHFCEDCGDSFIAKTAARKRCSKCQETHKRELQNQHSSAWQRRNRRLKKVRTGVDDYINLTDGVVDDSYNHDPNFEFCIQYL